MEELDLTQIFKYFFRKIPIILIMTTIFLLAGYLYTDYIQIPMYHGKTTIILVPKNNNDSTSDTENELKINEKLISTYSEIIKSRRVLDQVIEKLNLKTTSKKLGDQIEISSVETTAIIEIAVSNKNNKQAAKIANEVAEVFKKEITEIYNLENISIIDKAIVENKPYNVSATKQIIIFTFGGIALSCGIIFIMYYFDNSIKTKNEIEEKLNLAVLGEIPLATKLDKKSKKTQKKEKKSSKEKKQETIKKEEQQKKVPKTKEKTTSKEKNVDRQMKIKKTNNAKHV